MHSVAASLRAPARRVALRATAGASSRSLSLRTGSFRRFSTEPPKPAPKSSNTALFVGLGAALVAAGGGYLFFSADTTDTSLKKAGQVAKVAANFVPTKEDYQKVYNAIADKLEKDPEYDDGSYGPVVLRLAWHSSGTYDKETGTGGSNYATMRFAPEALHGANAGLNLARDYMEDIKQQFPWISYGDLWTLGGVCAIQEMGGPTIRWRPGRIDGTAENVTPDGRLPDASQGPRHLRDIFYRMGFNDQEIVALSGAHALGRCHRDRSGFDGPWTFSPVTVSNEYFRLLLDEKWVWRSWDGPKQFQDKGSKSLMMLPTDYCLVQDKAFKPWVKAYAADEALFFKDFAKVIETLFELGVPRAQFVSSEPWTMTTREEQEAEKK